MLCVQWWIKETVEAAVDADFGSARTLWNHHKLFAVSL